MANHVLKTDSLLQKIGRAIVNNEYPLDRAIPTEAELCEEHDVSRIVIREVVKMLSSKGMLLTKGMVTEYNIRGTWVRPRSDWNLLDHQILEWLTQSDFSIELLSELNETRFPVESYCAKLAAERASNQSIALIKTALIGIETAELEYLDLLEARIAFHNSVLNACGNRFYQQFWKFIEVTLRYNHRFITSHRINGIYKTSDYLRIYRSIENRKPEAAYIATQKLLSRFTFNDDWQKKVTDRKTALKPQKNAKQAIGI